MSATTWTEVVSTAKDRNTSFPLVVEASSGGGSSLDGTVTDVVGIRPKEFGSGLVFTVRFTDRDGQTGLLQCYDQWAVACSFIVKGDVIRLRGFTVYCVLGLPSDTNGATQFICISPNGATVLSVLSQYAPGDDVIELTLTEPHLDNPAARVLPKYPGAGGSECKSILADQAHGTGRTVVIPSHRMST